MNQDYQQTNSNNYDYQEEYKQPVANNYGSDANYYQQDYQTSTSAQYTGAQTYDNGNDQYN